MEDGSYTLIRGVGRPKIYETPDDFQRACEEYFAWCQKNPLLEHTVMNTKSGLQNVQIEKVRCFTVLGLCNFLGISRQTLEDYGDREEFVDTFTRVKEIIYNQKFENAAAGLINPQFIGKDLGLVDNKDINHKNDGGKFTGETHVHFHDYEDEE